MVKENIVHEGEGDGISTTISNRWKGVKLYGEREKLNTTRNINSNRIHIHDFLHQSSTAH